jgi:hypothetical protein
MWMSRKRIEVDSLQVDGVDVAEVNYEYDLVNKTKLLGKYIGETIYLKRKDIPQNQQCHLLSAGPEIILEDAQTGEVMV